MQLRNWIRELSLVLAITACSLHAAQMSSPPKNTSDIRVVPVKPTPEPDNLNLVLAFPKANDVISSSPVNVQVNVEGFPLGVDSDFNRSKEIYNSDDGQTLRVVIDDQPFFIENNSLVDSFYDNQLYYEVTVNFQIPFTLKPGQHVMRIFPARSYGESMKGDNAFRTLVFNYKNKKTSFNFNPNSPFLTYNEPQGHFKYKEGRPILLDFLVTNCRLSRDGYKVRLTIDGNTQRILTLWVPYYVYGLAKGNHYFRLELLDSNNNLVPGPFNDIQREIVIK